MTKQRCEQHEATAPASAPVAILGDYLDTEGLAAEFGVSPITVVRWRLQRYGPPVTRFGRKILYRRTAVAKWLLEQERQAA
jgi:hypothetical protein